MTKLNIPNLRLNLCSIRFCPYFYKKGLMHQFITTFGDSAVNSQYDRSLLHHSV